MKTPEEKIQNLHPEPGKQNKAIGRQSYEVVKQALVTALRERERTHTELMNKPSQNVWTAGSPGILTGEA